MYNNVPMLSNKCINWTKEREREMKIAINSWEILCVQKTICNYVYRFVQIACAYVWVYYFMWKRVCDFLLFSWGHATITKIYVNHIILFCFSLHLCSWTAMPLYGYLNAVTGLALPAFSSFCFKFTFHQNTIIWFYLFMCEFKLDFGLFME